MCKTFIHCGVLVWIALACAAAQGQRKAIQAVATIPFNYSAVNNRTDALGFRWDLNQNGYVGDGTNDCFDNGLMLYSGNHQFQCSQPKMTPNGNELILSGKVGTLQPR